MARLQLQCTWDGPAPAVTFNIHTQEPCEPQAAHLRLWCKNTPCMARQKQVLTSHGT
jgi:hypothetical protein